MIAILIFAENLEVSLYYCYCSSEISAALVCHSARLSFRYKGRFAKLRKVRFLTFLHENESIFDIFVLFQSLIFPIISTFATFHRFKLRSKFPIIYHYYFINFQLTATQSTSSFRWFIVLVYYVSLFSIDLIPRIIHLFFCLCT